MRTVAPEVMAAETKKNRTRSFVCAGERASFGNGDELLWASYVADS